MVFIFPKSPALREIKAQLKELLSQVLTLFPGKGHIAMENIMCRKNHVAAEK